MNGNEVEVILMIKGSPLQTSCYSLVPTTFPIWYCQTCELWLNSTIYMYNTLDRSCEGGEIFISWITKPSASSWATINFETSDAVNFHLPSSESCTPPLLSNSYSSLFCVFMTTLKYNIPQDYFKTRSQKLWKIEFLFSENSWNSSLEGSST